MTLGHHHKTAWAAALPSGSGAIPRLRPEDQPRPSKAPIPNPLGQKAGPKAWRPLETAATKSAGNAEPIATRDRRCRAAPGTVKMAAHQVNGTTTRP